MKPNDRLIAVLVTATAWVSPAISGAQDGQRTLQCGWERVERDFCVNPHDTCNPFPAVRKGALAPRTVSMSEPARELLWERVEVEGAEYNLTVTGSKSRLEVEAIQQASAGELASAVVTGADGNFPSLGASIGKVQVHGSVIVTFTCSLSGG